MLSTAYPMLLENNYHSSGKWHKWHAVAAGERFAEFVPFQRQQPGHSRHQNANSALRSLTSAC